MCKYQYHPSSIRNYPCVMAHQSHGKIPCSTLRNQLQSMSLLLCDWQSQALIGNFHGSLEVCFVVQSGKLKVNQIPLFLGCNKQEREIGLLHIYYGYEPRQKRKVFDMEEASYKSTCHVKLRKTLI